ncbi:MAG TPA: hypothetical protein VMB91_11730 [Solirubrobacteraceae bacterium]|nr:hypothetical protein [Solirubrobacteraceae bacterium]
MRRKTFDIVASWVGVAGVIVLLVAGSLLAWGASYTKSNVHSQLAAQEIYFPPKSAFAHPVAGTEITPSMIPSVSQYAGQQLLTGAQAKVWADDFIAVHLREMPYHGLYAKISAAALKEPTNAKLQELVQVSFRGTTLRGLLLEAYGFATVGTVMMWASIAAFALAALLALLVVLGFRHARRTEPEAELLRIRDREPVPTT